MSHDHSTPAGPDSLVITAVICAVLFGALGWVLVQPGDEAPDKTRGHAGDGTYSIGEFDGFAWPTVTFDAARLTSARARFHDLPDEVASSKEIEKLIEVVQLANDHQFTTQPIPSKKLKELTAMEELAVSDAVTVTSKTSFVEAGEPVFKNCSKALAGVQRDLAAGELELAEVLLDIDYSKYENYRRNCGNMLAMLDKVGLIDGRGQWTRDDGEQIAQTLQRYRWAFMAQTRWSPIEQLPEYERKKLVQWRASSRDAFSPRQHKRFVTELIKVVPEFPEGIALALLASDEGRDEDAMELLSRYKNQQPDNPLWGELQESLRKKSKK